MFAYCGNNTVNLFDPSGYIGENTFSYISLDSPGYRFRRYDVPLYSQGKLNLCWAYSQVMVEDYHTGVISTQVEADERAKNLAISVHGEKDGKGKEIWNKGGWPTNIGEAVPADGLSGLYNSLENGPIYGYYWSGKPKSGAHLVVVTGVDVYERIVYTNNPWGLSGKQTYEEFINGYLGMSSNTEMPLYSLYLVH